MGRGTPCWEELILASKTCSVVGPSTKSGLCKAVRGNGGPATAQFNLSSKHSQLSAAHSRLGKKTPMLEQ